MDQGLAFVTGRISQDPKFFGEGEKQRAVFTVAYNRGTGERRKSNFIDCIAWGKRADIIRDFKKGMGIFVTGDLEQDSFENKEGKKVTRVQVNVTSITATTSTRRNTTEETSKVTRGNSEEVTIGGDDSAEIPF